MNYKCFLIREDISIVDAMKKLNETAKKVLFIVDENDKLLASLSDGDIRRFLLNGGTLDSKAILAGNTSPYFAFDTQRSNASSLFVDNIISAIPIVNESLCVLDVVFNTSEVDVSKANIRKMTFDDEKLIFDFFDQMAGDTRAMFNRADANTIRLKNYFENKNDDEIHFIATVKSGNEEIVVGYVFLWELDKGIPWFGIAVHEHWKGKHLGRKLIEYVDNFCIENGYGGVMLTTVMANIRAHSLYSRMGFEYMGTHTCGEFLYIKRYPKNLLKK